MKSLINIVCYAFILALLTACNSEPGSELANHLTFYASFDDGFEADIALGDPTLYIAPSLSRAAEELEPYDGQDVHGRIVEGEGRYGNALHIDLPYDPILFYRGETNMPYSEQNWSGTVSFWMKLDPADLAPGYSDPIQITSRGWNDGALFVDFTDEDPRIFRFAIFPDREVWDAEERDWNDVPIQERPMVDVPEPPFSNDRWTHVAFTFHNFNTGNSDGVVNCYLDGQLIDTLSGREKTITWTPDRVAIWLGYTFRGYLDELSIFDRSLTDKEILQIYELENGIRDL